MRLPKIDPGVLACYWMGALYESVDRGDVIMTEAARGQLRTLGFDVRPARPRRRRAPATSAN